MSAWIVSKKHIDLLVAAAGSVGMVPGNPHQLGQELWHENHLSVNYRYGEDTLTPPYQFTPEPNKSIDLVVVLKNLGCYSYQSCEHTGWETSASFKFCEELKARVIAALPKGMTEESVEASPEYSAAPWGIK